MKRRILIFSVLTIATLILVTILFLGFMQLPSKEGFTLTFLENNGLLISNADIISYNETSQEIAITENASATRIQAPSIIDANVVITGQVPLTRILATASASANISISALMVGEILGETWSDVSGRTVTWSIN